MKREMANKTFTIEEVETVVNKETERVAPHFCAPCRKNA
jgi:hypothetical protein